MVGGLLFCFLLPQSATHTVTQSADTAFAMKLERREKAMCASVKRTNGVLPPSTKINCVNKAEPDIVTLYRISASSSGSGGG